MTTNKYGGNLQTPLFACAGYCECTYRAEDLREHSESVWCDICWEETNEQHEYTLPEWDELEPFVPLHKTELEALQAECEWLRETLTEARDLVAEWGDYASDYFKEKHGLERDIARLDAAIKGEEQ